MNTFLQLTEDEFADTYRPIANHLNPNASFDWGDGFGTLFETYGEELQFVLSQPVNQIWTYVSTDEGDVIASGFHFVNRLGYFITAKPFPISHSIEVTLESFD